MKELVKGGLLTAMRGKGGGYRLRKTPAEYNIKDIIELMEGSLAPIACLDAGSEACPRKDTCLTLPLWEGLDRVISEYLSQFTLADLLAQEKTYRS